MKPSAILINIARGGLVDELALKSMLKNKLLAAAAFDVFSDEPPLDKELLGLPNFLATPILVAVLTRQFQQWEWRQLMAWIIIVFLKYPKPKIEHRQDFASFSLDYPFQSIEQ